MIYTSRKNTVLTKKKKKKKRRKRLETIERLQEQNVQLVQQFKAQHKRCGANIFVELLIISNIACFILQLKLSRNKPSIASTTGTQAVKVSSTLAAYCLGGPAW